MQSGSQPTNCRKRTFIYSHNKIFMMETVECFSGNHLVDHGTALGKVLQHKRAVVKTR